MSHSESINAQIDDDMEKQRAELVTIIRRFAPEDGIFPTTIAQLHMVCHDRPVQSIPTLVQPALCILAQGSKDVRLGEEKYTYDPLNYLVISVAMPISGCIQHATPENPNLALRIDIDPVQINALIAEAGPMSVPTRPTGRGLYIERIDAQLLDAVLRLTRLLSTPKDIAMLAPLIQREIIYRLLRSQQGHRLYEIAIADSQTHRVTQAIKWLNSHYIQPMRIEDLAREVNLSVSTLHHRFKSVTAMSPLQYQKQLRLQEARRLMLADGLDASAAGYRVGYESPSQFSREYSRQFGAPPSRDLARLRQSV
ncbi:AraC family transcriptional regulator [Pseudomonas sp. CCI3.2]|uniref:AraC family transcriptional regulator n=1 Tax=unclassified Pseudomonas TaxID=196821 RepID=UPI002AC93A04|nr:MULTISPECIES: AraC family transcriptional regulator [unclassified Pseudomonas]MEB0075576.1 AraC family transcriptional regulator [Pseudomonas sp. MH10out]MEB0103850.1 AraC family transcriptional regulator [Pseudomonas sp. CCI3.2]MEB0130389.1 AraC family transcriptional regulator [Pseudomonas sp. CCI2.4]MEB0159413.1 AraC family transcriptional regulator [Pseudomonas sp. AH2 (2023)]MEB0170159.1 AraC family transcriptional regulator [Pseudomonas sp. CCC4.4]